MPDSSIGHIIVPSLMKFIVWINCSWLIQNPKFTIFYTSCCSYFKLIISDNFYLSLISSKNYPYRKSN